MTSSLKKSATVIRMIVLAIYLSTSGHAKNAGGKKFGANLDLVH